MSPKAVIFDRDGVLTYFRARHAASYFSRLGLNQLDRLLIEWNQLVHSIGEPKTIADEERLFRTFWDQLAKKYDLSTQINEQLRNIDYTLFMAAHEDAEPVLSRLKNRNIRIGVLSNFGLASIDKSLEKVGLAQFIDVAAAAPVIGAKKPDPKAYLHILDAMEIGASDCLYIDDEWECVQGAQSVGMVSFWLCRKETHEQQGIHKIDSLLRVLEYFDGS